MLAVLAVTVPIYLVIAAGCVATRAGLFARAEMRVFGKYVIFFSLPALLFNALSQRSVAEVLNPVFLGVYAGGSLIAMLMGVLWARASGKPWSSWPPCRCWGSIPSWRRSTARTGWPPPRSSGRRWCPSSRSVA